jgi:Arc/MetJ-type ribon-helix-helix transcriptional regulator
MKTISLKLPESLDAKLSRVAKQRDQSKSEVVREALEQMLNGSRAAKPLSALDLAGDLAGCLEGPGDLSTNSKYMEGYGR